MSGKAFVVVLQVQVKTIVVLELGEALAAKMEQWILMLELI